MKAMHCTTLLISTQIYCLCLHQLLLGNGVVTWAEMGLYAHILVGMAAILKNKMAITYLFINHCSSGFLANKTWV